MKYFYWNSAVALVLAIFAVSYADYRMATVHAGMSNPAHSGAELVEDGGPAAPLAAEDNFAWDEFAALVHPQARPGAAPPQWLAWYNKCEAGLTAACKLPADKPPDQGAVEFPRQLPEGFQLPVFDSVLFNPIAADSIRRGSLGRASSLDLAIQQLDLQNLSGADRRLPLGTFAIGSEIVKLIWEVMPDDKEETLQLYDPEKPPVAENGTQLLKISGWQARYKIDRKVIDGNVLGEIDQNKDCSEPLKPYGTEEAPQSVPLKCFYSFSVQKNSCPFFNQDPQHPLCSPANTERFFVFLVGFHVMKLTPGNPDWVWSTYYWTRETNENENGGKKWNAPWNHFHQMTTTAIRENALPPHDICYNPYLEGQQKNGLKANCLSCHSFAAYAPNVDKLSGGGAEDGLKYPYPRAKRILDEQDYFRGAVQTGFVWSISTSQNKPGGR